jgi:hypothetical protein
MKLYKHKEFDLRNKLATNMRNVSIFISRKMTQIFQKSRCHSLCRETYFAHNFWQTDLISLKLLLKEQQKKLYNR